MYGGIVDGIFFGHASEELRHNNYNDRELREGAMVYDAQCQLHS